MQLLVALLIGALALGVAFVLRRQSVDAPTQLSKYGAPDQLDRNDFDSTSSWLVVVFTSATCQACQSVLTAVAPLADDSLSVIEVEYLVQGDLHKRYQIEAVPTLVLADSQGVVRYSALGPQKAVDLWAAVSEALTKD